MGDKQISSSKKKCSVADRLKFSISRDVSQEESPEVSDTIRHLPKLIENIPSRIENQSPFIRRATNESNTDVSILAHEDLFKKEFSDTLGLATSYRPSEKNSPQIPGLKPFFSKPAEEFKPSIKPPGTVLRRLYSTAHLGKETTPDAALSNNAFVGKEFVSIQECSFTTVHYSNELSSRRKDEDIMIRNKLDKMKTIWSKRPDEDSNLRSTFPSNNGNEYVLRCSGLIATVRNEDLRIGYGPLAIERKEDVSIVNGFSASVIDEDIQIGNEFFASGRDQNIHFRSEAIQNKHVKDITNQPSEGIGGDNPHIGSLDVFSLNAISLEYWQLYSETRTENYDFPMNIMAYIELLNDFSWKATISYFDENVKRMVKCIWNERNSKIYEMMDTKKFHPAIIQKLMSELTQRTLNRVIDFGYLLSYSVEMCQLGVIGRKNNFRNAPLFAIRYLRKRINLVKFENLKQIMFDIAVNEYAKKQVGYYRV